jgi:aminocarboxymuconate-semialdehyde decarboxylase
LIDLVGADRVMFGTDYPFEIGDAEGKHALPTINALPAADRDKILGGNAADALRRAGLDLSS